MVPGSGFMLPRTKKLEGASDRSYARTREAAVVHIFAITSPPSGVHIFAWPANFRNFAPKPCIFSHTTPVRRGAAGGGAARAPARPSSLVSYVSCEEADRRLASPCMTFMARVERISHWHDCAYGFFREITDQ